MSFVSVHALSAGYLTLPERFFVTPLEDVSVRKTVPSLSFLIQHKDRDSGRIMRIVFDLGIRRKLQDYAPPIYKHAQTRQPLSGDHDTVKSLANGGLGPDDIDVIMFSHLHWDHVGTPSDYPNSTYVVGPGAAKLINGKREPAAGSHNHFEEGMLDMKRTIELPPVGLPLTPPPLEEQTSLSTQTQRLTGYFSQPWHRKGRFEAVLDVFGDGSLHVVSAPGHIDGHINLLCRLEDGKHVYLAGDSCHDGRLLTREKDIATWTDEAYPGVTCCIHQDKAQAEKTLSIIRDTIRDPGELKEVEVVFAHDGVWEKQAEDEGRFFPGTGCVSIKSLILAKAAGVVTIITSSSDNKLEDVKKTYGVDHDDEVRKITNGNGVDYILETGGTGTVAQSLSTVPIVVISVIELLAPCEQKGMPDVALLAFLKASVVRGIIIGSRRQLEEVTRFMSARDLEVPVEKEFGFSKDQVVEAYKYLRLGQRTNKVCINVG